MGFSRQEYWSGLTCPPPRNLPNPALLQIFPTQGLNLHFLHHLHWQVGGFFTTSATWEALSLGSCSNGMRWVSYHSLCPTHRDLSLLSSKLHIKAASSREPSQMKQVSPDNPDLLSLGPQQLLLFLSYLPPWLGTTPSPHISVLPTFFLYMTEASEDCSLIRISPVIVHLFLLLNSFLSPCCCCC